MNFKLQQPYQFEHLKIWFRENWHGLPKTLDTDTMRIGNVKHSVELYIVEVTRQIELHGDRALSMSVFRASTARLIVIYEGLKDESKWNLPLEKAPEKTFR